MENYNLQVTEISHLHKAGRSISYVVIFGIFNFPTLAGILLKILFKK